MSTQDLIHFCYFEFISTILVKGNASFRFLNPEDI